MSPKQAIPGDKINPFLPTRRCPTVDHSLAAGDAQRQWLQARLPDGHQPQSLLSSYFPEFAQAVRYGVPGTPSMSDRAAALVRCRGVSARFLPRGRQRCQVRQAGIEPAAGFHPTAPSGTPQTSGCRVGGFPENHRSNFAIGTPSRQFSRSHRPTVRAYRALAFLTKDASRRGFPLRSSIPQASMPTTDAYYHGNQDPHKSLQPIAAPEGSEINHGIHRNTRKRESVSTSPFRVLPGGNSRP